MSFTFYAVDAVHAVNAHIVVHDILETLGLKKNIRSSRNSSANLQGQYSNICAIVRAATYSNYSRVSNVTPHTHWP